MMNFSLAGILAGLGLKHQKQELLEGLRPSAVSAEKDRERPGTAMIQIQAENPIKLLGFPSSHASQTTV
jgi:hypothetical protein